MWRFIPIGIFLSACATVGPIKRDTSKPYLITYPGPKVTNNWFVDGPVMNFDVVNPLGHAIEAQVVCITNQDEFTAHVYVPARSSKGILGQVMNRDVMADVCSVWDWIDK